MVFVAEEAEEQLSLESDNKVFFFDIGENQYGDYLRISEVLSLCITAVWCGSCSSVMSNSCFHGN